MISNKKYIITSAQANAKPHANFLRGLNNYCKDNDYEIIVLPMIGKSAIGKEDWTNLSDVFSKYNVLYNRQKLNNNLKIEQFNVRPYQIDPLTGLNRFAQRETSLIFASPKQRLKPVPHSSRKMPKYLITTGACTYPNYANTMDDSAERRRLGDIARRDHIIGALSVQIKNNQIYYIRNIRADTTGKFIDLGIKYDGDKKSTSELEVMVLGDYHNGETDKKTKEATYEMIKDHKPKRLILHDFFDGHSINPHMEKQFIEQKLIHQVDIGHHKLERELKEGYNELMHLNDIMNNKEIVIVPSNHHDFLNRYLNEGKFMEDTTNIRYALKLASYMAEKDKNNPVEEGLRMIGEIPENIKFLDRDKDYKIKGYQLGAHGDKGAGGRRASSLTMKENDCSKSITGHVHKLQMLRDTYTVGTMLPLDTYYTRGNPLDWGQGHAMLWDNGTVQLIQLINGKYKIE